MFHGYHFFASLVQGYYKRCKKPTFGYNIFLLPSCKVSVVKKPLSFNFLFLVYCDEFRVVHQVRLLASVSLDIQDTGCKKGYTY
jgi:hypothetical protein